jgi:hypothetical protein
MNKKFFIFSISIFAAFYFLGFSEVSAQTCTLPSSCQYNRQCEHIVKPFPCLDGLPSTFYSLALDYYTGGNDSTEYNYVNIDDDGYLTPGSSVYFIAPIDVLVGSKKVKGFWLRHHDHEDNFNYIMYGCESVPVGGNCSSGWYELESGPVHTSGEACKEPCSDNDKTNQGCPDPLPDPRYCAGEVSRYNWPCAISFDEEAWPESDSTRNTACADTDIKAIKIDYPCPACDAPDQHVHIADVMWIMTDLTINSPTCEVIEGGVRDGTRNIFAGDTLTFNGTTYVDPSASPKDPDIRMYLNSSQTISGASLIAENYSCSVPSNSCSTSVARTFNTPGTYYVFCRGWNDAVSECRPFDNQANQLDCGPYDVMRINVSPQPVSCTVSLSPDNNPPNPLQIQEGEDVTLRAFPVPSPAGSPIDYVLFVSGDPAKMRTSPSPYQDFSPAYVASYTNYASAGDTVQLEARVIMNGAQECYNSVDIEITASDPWWQAENADVWTNSNLTSQLPASEYFDLRADFNNDGNPDAQGYPGVPVYNGSTNLTTSNASQTGWVSKASHLSSIYDYSYFMKKVTENIKKSWTQITTATVGSNYFRDSGSVIDGYKWFFRDGSLTLTGGQFLDTDGDTDKVVLFVNGDLNINERVKLQDGTEFFMAIVSGNINANYPNSSSGLEPELEGIYVANGRFNTGSYSNQLKIRGSVVAWDGVRLQRDMGNNNSSTPSEYFKFGPDLLFKIPSIFGRSEIQWKEVAP